MSGSSVDDAGPERDLIAAEYVLGTLDKDDRAALAREAEVDPDTRAAIEAWERRLSPLLSVAAPATPPASLWSRIESSAWGGAAAKTPTPSTQRPSRRLRFWQGGTAAGFALAAALAGVAVLRAPPLNTVTALLPLSKPGASVFIAEATPGGGLLVTPVGAVHVAPDRNLELWLLKSGEKVPKPLGLLPASGVRLAAGSVPQGIRAKILVSLEPRGGSPTGLPTGPVLWGGAL
ncbi:anti-sigma factor [Lichenicoccus sp.]|uniref:anti-sigma factor n=1 Tax=Lichenicoccus sp. TaxID=2781899 RepID=UPI003D14E680